MRDKEGRGKHTPTMGDDWVNSVNTGFKVAELLTKMNPCILIFSIGSGRLERSTVHDSVEFIPLLNDLLSINSRDSELFLVAV